jgi:phosphoglycolate phosphatase
MKKGVIFCDIDGTLLHSGGSGLAAFTAAINEVFAIDFKFQRGHFAGNLDPLIFDVVLKTRPLEVQQKREEYYRRFKARYLELLAQSPASLYSVYPGVVDFLDRHQTNYELGIISGNFREGARLKLGKCDLEGYFSLGGYGDNGASRSLVAAHALAEARRICPLSCERIFVIGDTVHDVTCGKHIGAKTIAVCTGFSRREELESAQPDLLVENLAGLDLDQSFS